jgi:hypothetical protein
MLLGRGVESRSGEGLGARQEDLVPRDGRGKIIISGVVEAGPPEELTMIHDAREGQ